MPLDEMDALPEMIPTLRKTGFYIAGFNPVTDWLVTPLVLAGLKIAPERLLPSMSRLLFWSMGRFARPPFGTMLTLEASGVTGGEPHHLTARLFHEDGYVFTAVPVVATILQWLDSEARKPGLWYQAHIVDPERLVRDIAGMGIEISINENSPAKQYIPHPAI
jgi:saccharopine dehydrogenase (NAD+, L-lysine-forming)